MGHRRRPVSARVLTGYHVYRPADELQTRAHLRTLHGVWAGDVKTLTELIECHDSCHDMPIGDEVPHTHTRYDPDTQDQEWVW